MSLAAWQIAALVVLVAVGTFLTWRFVGVLRRFCAQRAALHALHLLTRARAARRAQLTAAIRAHLRTHQGDFYVPGLALSLCGDDPRGSIGGLPDERRVAAEGTYEELVALVDDLPEYLAPVGGSAAFNDRGHVESMPFVCEGLYHVTRAGKKWAEEEAD